LNFPNEHLQKSYFAKRNALGGEKEFFGKISMKGKRVTKRKRLLKGGESLKSVGTLYRQGKRFQG